VADQRVKDFAYQILEAQLANGMSGAQNPTQQFVSAVPTPASMQQPQVMSYSDIEPAFYEKRLPMEGRATFLPFRDTMEGSVFNKRELAVPGILAELMNAFTAPARSMTDPTFNAGEEAANMAMSVGGSGLAISRGMKAPTGQGGFDLAMNAYHGTPYDIKGGFDLSKVGTGEGAQVYGHGIYFGEAKATGEQYAKLLANRDVANQGRLNAHANAQRLVNLSGDPKYAADDIKFVLESNPDSPQKSLLEKTLKYIESGEYAKPLENKGNLYKVDIPDEQIPKMLDWDKPIAQQNKAILDILKNEPAILADLANGKSLDKLTGEQAYQAIASTFDVGQAEAYKLASEYLNSKGIPGIRYLDEGSRAAGKGTSNFVVFDPKTLKILEKNDMPVTE